METRINQFVAEFVNIKTKVCLKIVKIETTIIKELKIVFQPFLLNQPTTTSIIGKQVAYKQSTELRLNCTDIDTQILQRMEKYQSTSRNFMHLPSMN